MTNKYEDFVQKLLVETDKNKRKWAVADFSDYASHILNPDRVMRAFRTWSKEIKIVLIEFKSLRYSDDFDTHVEEVELFILLIKNNVLAKMITDKTVFYDLLSELLDTVSEKTTDIDDDINSFLQD